MRSQRIKTALRVAAFYALISGGSFFLLQRVLAGQNAARQVPDILLTSAGWLLIAFSTGLIYLVIQKAPRDREPSPHIQPDAGRDDLRGLYDDNPLMLITLDRNGQILAANRRVEELSGFNRQELRGKNALDFVLEEDRQMVLDQINETGAASGWVTRREFRVRNRAGNILWLRESARSLTRAGKKSRLFLVCEDITNEREAESKARLAETRFRALVEQVPAAIYTELPDSQGHQIYINPQIEKMTGYSPEEWLANPDLWESLIHPEDRQAVVREDQLTNLSLEPFRVEYRLIARDGHIVWLRDQADLVRDGDGTPLYWQGLLVDITEQKRVKEAILQSNERFRKVFRSSPIAIAITTRAGGRFIDANPAYLRLIGCSLQDLIGHSSIELGITQVRERQVLLERLAAEQSIHGVEDSFRALDGSLHDVLSFFELVHLDGQECILSMFYDLSQQNEARKSLARKEAILNAIAFTADQFLKTPEWTMNIHASLERLARAAEASRVYIFEVLPDKSTKAVVSQLFEWSSADAAPQIDNPALQEFDMFENGLARWVDLLMQGQPVYGKVDEFPPEERIEFQREDIRSIACVPIMIEDEWWGFIGLDDCAQERNWSDSEIEALKTAANILSAAIQREREGEAARKQLKELLMLHAVALASSNSTQQDGLISSITAIIDNTLHPDNCGILLLDRSGQYLEPHSSYKGTVPAEVRKPHNIKTGVSGRVVSSGMPLRIADVRAVYDYVEVSPGIRSELCVPIISDEQVVGVINIESRRPDAFDEADERLIRTIAGSLATGIRKIRLFEAEGHRARQAEALREATTALTSSLEFDTLSSTTLDLLANFVPYRSASIELIERERVRVIAGRGLQPDRIGQTRPLEFEKWAVSNRRQPVMTRDVAGGESLDRFQGPGSTRYSMEIPLYAQDHLIGFIKLEHEPGDFFTDEHASLAQTFANQAAIAIANARMFQEQKRRTQIIEALAEIANEFAATQETAQLLDMVAGRSRELLGASHVAIYLLQSDSQTVKIVAAQGMYRNELTSHTIRIGEGITGSVIAAGRAEIINSIQDDPRAVTVPGTPRDANGQDTMMSAPLILHGQSIGAINAWRSRSEGLFDDSELNFLISIAHQTSISIGMSRLFEETRRRAQEAAAIAEVGRDISGTLELDIVLERIAQYARDLLAAETSAVYLQESGDTRLRAVAVIGVDAEAVRNDPLTLGTGIAGHIALSRHGEIVNYAASDPRAITILGTESDPAEHIMGVPVLSKDQLTGLLVVWRVGEEQEFEPAELRFLSSLAQQAAVAIQNARSFSAEQTRRLREASMLDLMRLAASSLDLDEVNQTILGHLIQLIPSDSGTIQLLRDESLIISAAAGFHPEAIRPGNRLLLDDFPLNHEVIKLKRPIRIVDVTRDERYRWIPGVEVSGSMLSIPIIFKESVIGMATLDSMKVARYTQEDEDLAMAVANNAASAIGNARLFELEQQGRQEAENLRRAASAVTSSLDPQQVLETILNALQQVVPYDSASILLLEGDQVRVTAAQGPPDRFGIVGRIFPARNRLLMAIEVNHNQPVIIYDAQIDPRFEQYAADEKIRGWMGVALVTREEVVGYITLDSHKVGTFDAKSAALAQTFAYQAAVAIDNARLYQETRRQVEELEVVSRVSSALRATDDPDEMLPALLIEVLKIMDTDAASIWLYDPATDQLHRKIASGWQKTIDLGSSPPDASVVGRVFRTGEIIIINDFGADPFTQSTQPLGVGIGSGGVGVPIRTSAQTIGALIVAVHLPRKIEPAQVQLLTTLAEIAGNAIHRARLYVQSEQQVRRLTALRDVDTAIASSFDLRVTLSLLLDHTLSQLHADAAAILSYNSELRTLTHISSLGFQERGLIQSGLRISGRLLNDALLERRGIHIDNIAKEPSFHRMELARAEGFSSYYAAPLISKGQVKGLLEIYFRQPHPPEADWFDFFQTMAGQAAIAIDNAQLFDNLQHSNQELSLAYDTTLEGWGKALELRDKETQGHTVRVTDLTLQLARRLGIHPADLVHVRRGVLLHDIGKMAVPDQILKKTGPLNEEEWTEMRKHPQIAFDLLSRIAYLRSALDIPYCHHERWNGAGYPRGLKGEDIPISARIFAVVDVWDALLNDRPYRKAWPRQRVMDYISSEAGTQFDPRIAAEFLRMVEQEEIAAE